VIEISELSIEETAARIIAMVERRGAPVAAAS
jgi:regulator of PEP synthase PpsR (kinase-PPPase family)